MLLNYFRVAIRHLRKNRGSTIINIAGLSTGMAIALIIGLWINDELSYNHYFPNHGRIAQAMITQTSKEDAYTGPTVTMPMGKAFRESYKDLFSSVALTHYNGDHLFGYGDKHLNGLAFWAEYQFSEMFRPKMLRGNIASTKDPSTTLISQSLATALFGNDDPVGKTVRYDDRIDFKVGGVYEDFPRNTTFPNPAAILPWGNQENAYHANNTNWQDHNGSVYVTLANNVTAGQASARIRDLPSPYTKGWKETALVYPIDKLHLYDKFENGVPAGGRIEFVWLFGIIGGFVLLLACINFMNLSTARSEKRAREVGIRKTLGSLHQQLIFQFLTESVLMAVVAFVLSLAIAEAALPFFNQVANKKMSIPWGNGVYWAIAAAFTLGTGLLAGSYPAFYLSHFDPVKVLKGGFRVGRFAGLPRQVLVTLQFSVSLTLIIGTVIVFRQIQYARNQPVGYDRYGLVTVGINTPDLYKHYDALREELLQKGLVSNIATSSFSQSYFWNGNEVEWRGKRPDQAAIFFRNVNVSRDYGRTVGWNMTRGRDFSRAFATDSSAALVNEAGARAMGFANPVGETVKFFGKNYTVVGVVGDMITNSPYENIPPAIFLGDGDQHVITMRLKAGQPAHTLLAGIGEVFRKYNPNSPFLYNFIDEAYDQKFADEERIGRLAAVFTSLAIFISCLGLFGLASFVAEQRTRELGVRKVLGAGVVTLWGLLSKDFCKLVVISFFISMPIGYLLMNKWLENYHHHTTAPWWIFAAAGAGTLLVTLLTVSYQSLKAAMMSPVKSLRSE